MSRAAAPSIKMNFMRPCVKPPFLVRDTEFGGPKPLFCIPLVATDLKQLLMQAQTARDLKADLVEWRADSYGQQEKNSFLEAAQRLRSVLEREPILFTLRISSEGGLQQIPQGLRIACIDAVLRSGFVDLVDLELCNGSDIL